MSSEFHRVFQFSDEMYESDDEVSVKKDKTPFLGGYLEKAWFAKESNLLYIQNILKENTLDFTHAKYEIDYLYYCGDYLKALEKSLKVSDYYKNIAKRSIREIDEIIVRIAIKLEDINLALKHLENIESLGVTDPGIEWLRIETLTHFKLDSSAAYQRFSELRPNLKI